MIPRYADPERRRPASRAACHGCYVLLPPLSLSLSQKKKRSVASWRDAALRHAPTEREGSRVGVTMRNRPIRPRRLTHSQRPFMRNTSLRTQRLISARQSDTSQAPVPNTQRSFSTGSPAALRHATPRRVMARVLRRQEPCQPTMARRNAPISPWGECKRRASRPLRRAMASCKPRA